MEENANKAHLTKILREQVELLAEASKECSPEELVELSNSMAKLCLAYLQFDCYR